MRGRIGFVVAMFLWGAMVSAPLGAAGSLERISGPGRVATAVALSEASRAAATDVVLARADAYADALAGGPLAGRLDAPVLLTASAALSPEVEREIDRLGAERAHLLGGESAVSPQVEAELRAMGLDVRRLSGRSRFHTARAVAEELEAKAAYVVQGNSAEASRGWPDAVSVSALAAYQRRPILLTEKDFLPEAVAQTIEELGIEEIGIIGGTGAVSAAVEISLRELVPNVYRIAGSSRYATARLVGNQSVNAGMTAARTWLATGHNYPDALAAGPAVAADGGVLLLVDGKDLRGSPDTVAWLDTHHGSLEHVRLVGGLAAVSAEVEEDVRRVASGMPPAPDPTPSPTPSAQPSPTPTPTAANCDPSYPTVCIPPPPPDLDCGEISHRNFTVYAPDPHDFDRDRDGIGCET